jgi:drug/metabolite transporter (DMT)-like permease
MEAAERTAPPSAPFPAAPRRDEPVRGVLLLLGALLLFSGADLLAKLLNADMPPVEIAWLRYVVFAGVLVPLVLRAGPRLLRAGWPGLQIVRGLGILGSAIGFVSAVRYVPLAEATATGFISPVFITALSVVFLGERPGIRRWSAIAAGIIGMLIIVRPGGQTFQWASLFAVASAASWACAMVVTRHMARGDGVLTTMCWTALTGLVVLSLALPVWAVVPPPGVILLGLFAGLLNTAGQWLTLLAYRLADASLLAPVTYAQLITATLLGWLVFGAIPDRWTICGALVIVASGLYIAQRERSLARRRLQVA